MPKGAEAKSSNVLPILDSQPRAFHHVLRQVETYSIFIVDLHEPRQRVLDDIVEHLRPLIPPGVDPYDFVLQIPHPDSKPHQWIREIAVQESVVGRLESLLSWCTNPFAEEMERHGLGLYADRRDVKLTDLKALARLDDRQFASFLARFGAALGDALSPECQAAAMMDSISEHRYFVGGHFACQVLQIDVETDKIFDIGPAPVLLNLELADERVWSFVEEQVAGRLFQRVRRGSLNESPSHVQLGLQAADIAAALASREYECASDDRPLARAWAVRRFFSKVMLNGRWV